MKSGSAAICFQCGGAAEVQGSLNRLSDGSNCPTCADRLLFSLPPLLPRFSYGVELDVAPAPASTYDANQPA